MRWRVLLALVAVVVVYLVLGAVGFHYLESEEEKGHKNLVQNFTRYFLEEHECLTEEDIRKMVFAYIEAYDRGIIEIANTSSALNWDMASSVFFAITVITTIGYGNIYPVTTGGQAFCVVYAIIGIPLCLVFLAGIGQKLRNLFGQIDKVLGKCDEMSKPARHGLKIFIIIIVGLVCFLLLPALMFVYIDGWSYAQALYYSVITLTAVGFGDFVAGVDDSAKEHRSVYRIMIGVWIFVGLAWVAGVITFIQDGYTDIVDKAQKSMNKNKANSMHDAEEAVSAEPDKVSQSKDDTQSVPMETHPNGCDPDVPIATEVDDLVSRGNGPAQITTNM